MLQVLDMDSRTRTFVLAYWVQWKLVRVQRRAGSQKREGQNVEERLDLHIENLKIAK